MSNVGTYGLDSAFAPVPPFCHVPAGILVGAVTDKVVAREGQPIVRPTLPLAIGLDHRFVDGYQAATMAKIFREYLADPARFDPVPVHRRRRARTRAEAPAGSNGHKPRRGKVKAKARP